MRFWRFCSEKLGCVVLLSLFLQLLICTSVVQASSSDGDDLSVSQGNILWFTASGVISSKVLDRLKSLRWKGDVLMIRYQVKAKRSRKGSRRPSVRVIVAEWQIPILSERLLYCRLDFSKSEPTKVDELDFFNDRPDNPFCFVPQSLVPLVATDPCQVRLGVFDDLSGDFVERMRKCVVDLNDKYRLKFYPEFVLDDALLEEARVRSDLVRSAFEVKTGSMKKGFEDFFFSKAKMIQTLGVQEKMNRNRYVSRQENGSVKIPVTLLLNKESNLLFELGWFTEKNRILGMNQIFVRPSVGAASEMTSIISSRDELRSMVSLIQKESETTIFLFQPFFGLSTVWPLPPRRPPCLLLDRLYCSAALLTRWA